jgi:phosphopantothenoylcysteine decarboxylase/phosphopantothenate--cysteine ligase
MLKGKKILLGISGSIAAYKSAILVRLLKKAGADVKIVMTPASLQFVAPLTLSTLSKNQVHSELSVNDSWSNHVELGRWADVMLIAPLSCNTLSKMANGACDNLLMAVYLSATCPVVVAPAMDEDMWKHPSTEKNIKTIESYGNKVIPVEDGELASGLSGLGRMAEPEHIIQWLNNFFSRKKDLVGKKILITAGPTQESIDPVRYLSNRSTGKMGLAIAEECYQRGAIVTLICGTTELAIPTHFNPQKVTTAKEMYNAALSHFEETDVAILSAAVADYTISEPSVQKIKKTTTDLVMQLVKTPDILKTLGSLKKPHQMLVGFALETENEIENAMNKLQTKNADYIILNSMKDEGAGFGVDTNKISIFDSEGQQFQFDLKSKQAVAKDIINTIFKISNE